jgi:hypothetical protein
MIFNNLPKIHFIVFYIDIYYVLLIQEEEMEARLPSDDDDDNKADPLSFLPDPDKVYGSTQSDSDSDSDG